MQFFYVCKLHIIIRGFEYYMKGQNEGCSFECIFLKLQILVLSKRAVFIARGAISCEAIRPIQNYLLCQLFSNKVSPLPLCLDGPAVSVAHLLSSPTLLPHHSCDLLLRVSLLESYIFDVFAVSQLRPSQYFARYLSGD